jgi:hypothetical protein
MRRLFGRRRSSQKPRGSLAPASIDLVWEQTQSLAAAQERRHADLEGKTIPLLAFGLAFEVFLRELSTPSPLSAALRDALAVLVAGGLLATLVAILPRPWDRVPKLKRFVEDANWEPRRLKERYLRDYLDAHEANELVLGQKFLLFKIAVLVYAVALGVGSALSIWTRG